MIISCLEMDKFIIPPNWEIKPFDLKLILINFKIVNFV